MIFFLTNILSPYRIGLFNEYSRHLKDIVFYFDKDTEKNREWNLNEDKIKFRYYIKNSFRIHRNSRINNNTTLYRTIYIPFWIIKEIIIHRPEIIISSEFGLRSLFALLTSKITRSKFLIFSEVTEFSEGAVSKLLLSLRKLIIRNAAGGIAQGSLSARYLEGLGLDKSRITISPYSIDNKYYLEKSAEYSKSDLRKKLNISDDAFVIFYSGQFIHRKGIDLLINVIENLPGSLKTRIKVCLAGGTDEKLNEICPAYNKDIFHPLGFLQPDDLVKYYVSADLFLLPTRLDTWALVVNEAIACGCPVMVSKYAGCTQDLIKNDISGYIFDPADEKDFNQVLARCITDRENSYKQALLAKKNLTNWSYETAGVNVARLVNSIMNEQS